MALIAFVAASLSSAPLAFGAGDVDITDSASIEILQQEYSDSLGNERCWVVPVVQFRNVEDATYTVTVLDRGNSLTGSTQVSKSGPPNDLISIFVGAPAGTLTFTAPGGVHWYTLAGFSGPESSCPGAVTLYTARFSVVSAIAHVDNLPPVAQYSRSDDPQNPLHVTFDGTASDDPDGSVQSYAWTVTEAGSCGTGCFTSAGSGSSLAVTVAHSGTYTVSLTVTDDGGASSDPYVRSEVIGPEARLESSFESITPERIKVDSLVDIKVILANPSTVTIDNVVPTLSVTGPSGPLTVPAASPLPPIPPGATARLSYSFTPTEPGTFQISFAAAGDHDGVPVVAPPIRVDKIVRELDQRLTVSVPGSDTPWTVATADQDGLIHDVLVGDHFVFRGTGWDPDGGPIVLRMPGHGTGLDTERSFAAAESFETDLAVDFPVLRGANPQCQNFLTVTQDGVTRTVQILGFHGDLVAYGYRVKRVTGGVAESNSIECRGWAADFTEPGATLVVQDIGGRSLFYANAVPPQRFSTSPNGYEGLWIVSPYFSVDVDGVFGDLELGFPQAVSIKGFPVSGSAGELLQVFGPVQFRSDAVISLAAKLIYLSGEPPPRTLEGAAGAGTNRLEVNSNGVNPGDRVRVNQGGPTQEDGTMDREGSIILVAPLRFDHAAGEPVIVLRPGSPGTCTLEATTPAAVGLSGSVRCANDGDRRYSLVTQPAHGQASIAADGAFTYTPQSGFVGDDVFTFRSVHALSTATMVVGDSGPMSFRVRVTQANRAPVCQPLSATVQSGQSIDITPNCSDLDGNAMVITIASPPASGVASMVGGTIRYVASAGAPAGSVTFSYHANDGQVSSAPATVTVAVTTSPAATLSVDYVLIRPATARVPSLLAASGSLLATGASTLRCGDDVTVRIGSFSETIPGARFRLFLGLCVYARPANGSGFIVGFTFDPRRGTWTVAGGGTTPTFNPFTNPVTVSLSIGPSSASKAVSFVRHGDTWTFPR